jgi:hypothetical protein
MKSMDTENSRVQDILVTICLDSATPSMFSVSMTVTSLMTRISHIFFIIYVYTGYGAAMSLFPPILLSFELNYGIFI